MAKTTQAGKRQSKFNPESISERDLDILTMNTKDVMKKYKAAKQAVYDRRFALNKKLKEAGLTLEQVQGNTSKPDPVAENAKPATENAKAKAAKKSKLKKANTSQDKILSESREVMQLNKQVPVIMKPIEISFENFSVKLNGVPKKISVNPDTNFIEIDL